jgi:GNAT superfamily N-acetyltransferase
MVCDYPLECECEAPLVDGTIVRIRPIHPDDAPDLADFHDHLSAETVRFRFFVAHPHLRAAEIERFTRVDYWDRLALIASVEGRLAAVARYDRLPGTDRAEVAFVVADELQGLGLGTLLLEHLSAAARRRGVASFVAETLWDNRPMQEVFVQAGFSCVRGWDGGVVEVSFPIGPTQSYLDALSARDVSSVHAWLQPLLVAAAPPRRPDAVNSATGRFVVEHVANGGLQAGRVGIVC